ncbi:hypothetical protein Hanom_Chr14g01271281 [Helianthus anomalus]
MQYNTYLVCSIIFYFCSKHWSLIIVCPDFKFCYIVDSINEGKTHKNYMLFHIFYK